jgi:hypothetical protein
VAAAPATAYPVSTLRSISTGGIVHDRVGVEMRHHVGVNQIMWSTDFPHQESEWPRSREILEKMMQGVPENER